MTSAASSGATQAFAHQQLHQAGTALARRAGARRPATCRRLRQQFSATATVTATGQRHSHSGGYSHSLRSQDLAALDKAIREGHTPLQDAAQEALHWCSPLTDKRRRHRQGRGTRSALGLNLQVPGVHQRGADGGTPPRSRARRRSTRAQCGRFGAGRTRAMYCTRPACEGPLEAPSEEQCVARLVPGGPGVGGGGAPEGFRTLPCTSSSPLPGDPPLGRAATCPATLCPARDPPQVTSHSHVLRLCHRAGRSSRNRSKQTSVHQ